MNEILTIKRDNVEIEIGYFDNQDEIEFCSHNSRDQVIVSIWFSPKECNDLINHLAKCLKFIKEPIDLLDNPK